MFECGGGGGGGGGGERKIMREERVVVVVRNTSVGPIKKIIYIRKYIFSETRCHLEYNHYC